ncbi:MAG: glutamate racemase [Magnetococcales bacterium]|nr:glutamate racemase [Magnetococcales bacterium]NGZ05924.1 glutamate racemase [Magnetococcales bacterium]
MNKNFDSRPIGVFDSGVGGLTVLRAMLHAFPSEHFIYLGDTARVPYGTKSASTIERYSLQVTQHLLNRGVKALVAACNTASALGLDAIRNHCLIPAMGVIEPGCRAALRATTHGRIGIIGTRATVRSDAYRQTLISMDPSVTTVSYPCPLFVPLVEEGWFHHPATRLIVEETLAPLHQENLDTLILGCTHFPLLKSVIAEILGARIRLIDSSEAIVDEINQQLTTRIVPASPDQKGTLTCLVTDATERFLEVAGRIIHDLPIEHVEMIDL